MHQAIKIYRRLFLLLLPFLLVVVLIPTKTRSRFVALHDYCFYQCLWLHDRITFIEHPVDIAIVGSSHTKNGINDGLIDSLMNKEDGHIAAFGVCELGRDMHLNVIKKLIQHKKPKKIVLEVREDENNRSHPVFPYVANTKDVISSVSLSNFSYFKNIGKHLGYTFEVLQGELYHKWDRAPFYHEHGYISSEDTTSIPKKYAWRIPKSNAVEDFAKQYSFSTIEKIAALCHKNNIELCFIYLPSYATISEPSHLNFYKSLGSVFLPPKDIFSNPNNFYDMEHLNAAGAEKLGNWLASELQREN